MMIGIFEQRPTLAVHLTVSESKRFAEAMKAAKYKGLLLNDGETVLKVCGIVESIVPSLVGKLTARVLEGAEVLAIIEGDSFDGRFKRIAPAPNAPAPEPATEPEASSAPQAASGFPEVEAMSDALDAGVRLDALAPKVRAVIEKMVGKVEWEETQIDGGLVEKLVAAGVAVPTHAAQVPVGPGAIRFVKLADGSVLVNKGDLEGFARVFVRP